MMRGIFTIWLREVLIFSRNRSRILGSMGMPIFFLLFIGTGLNGMASLHGGMNYSEFLAPGILGMILLVGSMFSGLSVVVDKQFGFMKEMLVAPVRREELVIGKALGGATTAMLQALLLLGLIYLLGIIRVDLAAVLLAVPFMLLMSFGFVSIGVTFASFIDDPHAFQAVMNFFIMPLFFLSSAFFPLDGIPAWLKALSIMDPATYGVDAMRGILVGTSYFPLWLDFVALSLFSIAAVLVGTWAFKRMKAS